MRTYSPGDEPIPGYRLIEQLGQGSFGVVWRAEGPGGVLVAMKVISNLNGIHAIREWQSLQNVMNLKQANLVEIYGVWLKNEENQVLPADEVRALIPQEAEPVGPVTETSAAAPSLPTLPRKSMWAGDKKSEKPAPTPTPHKLEGATLQPEDDPPTAASAAGSTATGSAEPSPAVGTHRSDLTKGTGSAQEVPSATNSGSAKGSIASSARGKWSKSAGVPPLELVSAMTLGEGTLMSRLKQCQAQGLRGIPRPELLRYMLEAAKGLGYLNDRKMHHCDVKPENLLLVGGSVKVCDYGSALRTIYSAESRTHQGYTEQYAAPEQLSGRKVKLHSSTDMYALALTYYALRTGKYPWGESATEPIAVVKYGEKFDFSALAGQSRYPYEWQVIRKALKRIPEDRHASPLEFVEALENAVRREEEAVRARRRRRFRNVALAVLAVLLIGAGIGSWIYRDKLPIIAPGRSQQDQFNSAVVANDVARAVEVANRSNPPLEPVTVAAGISTALRNVAADSRQAEDALSSVLTLKPEYREELKDSVQTLALGHFRDHFQDQIAKHKYAEIVKAVADHPGLGDWELADTIRASLIDQWLKEGKAALAAATHDPQHAGESAAPLAALAGVLTDDRARRSDIDAAVGTQLGNWLNAAESRLANVSELGQARDEYRFIARAADSYLQERSEAPAAIRTLRAAAQVGELAARFRLSGDNRAELVAPLAALSEGDLKSPAAQARRILLLRASRPANDPELVSERFLKSELPKLRSLPPGWEQETLDEIKARAIDVAEKQHQAGQLDNIDVVLKALQDDRLTLTFVHRELAAAARAAEASAFMQALATARERLTPLSKKLDKPADEHARGTLELWLTVLEADAPGPGQVMAAVRAFEAWDAAAGDDTRAAAWFPSLVEGLARRPNRWPKEYLTGEIAELETSGATSTSRIDRHLAALALRAQRLLILAVHPELSSEETAQLAQDGQRLVAARDDENDGALVGRFIEPPALVDALWAETQLAPLAVDYKPGSAISPETKGALDRVAAFLKDQPAAGTTPEDDTTGYLRYVADLYRAIARPPGDDLADVLAPPAADSVWLAPPRRHAVAATLLLQLAEQAGSVPLARGVDLSTYSDTFARQLPRLNRARAWAIDGSGQKIAAAARTALALCYAAGERNWTEILDASRSALEDRKACQSAITPEQYSYLLLVYAESLRQMSPSENATELIAALAEVLSRNCNLYDAGGGLFDDFDLYQQVAAPALALLADPAVDKEKLHRADLAAIYGAVGTLLERDTSRQIAVEHYEFNSGPNRYAAALVNNYVDASRYEDEPQRKLRWLAGEGMARDRQAELMPRDDYGDLVKELESIAGRIEALEAKDFAAAALRGLAAFYSVPKVNDVADLDSGAAQRNAALVAFRAGLTSLQDHPQAKSPWCRTWQSTIQRLSSHICLQQSWNLTWGPQMQEKLQEAIRFASEAKRSAPNTLEQALASATLGNSYEDMAFYLKCVPFYARAEQEFRAAQDAVKDIDPFQEFLFRRNLVRVQYRRLTHDPALTEQQRKDWKQKLPGDMEQLLKDTKTRGLDRYVSFTEYWLADMLSTLLEDDIEALTRAEDLYKNIPQDASAQAKAKRYFLAGDCAMRLAVLYADDMVKADNAVDRARRYMEPILELESEVKEPSTRSEIASLRADIAADRQDTLDGQFAQYVAESRRSSGVGGLSPVDQARLQIRLHLMVGGADCESDQNFGVRQAAVLEALRLLEDLKSKNPPLDDREYVTLKLRATSILLDRASAYHKRARPTKLPAFDLLKYAKQALEAARVAEGQIGTVECCAAPMEPSLGKVAGFDSVAETRSLRLAIARNLVQPIYDSDEPKAGKIAELKWIRAQLDEVKKALPREGEQATALRTIIDNNYLRLLERLLSLLEKS